MTDSTIPLAGNLEVVWHLVGLGLVIVVGVLWSWVIIGSWQRAKAEYNLHNRSLRNQTSHLSGPDASCMAPLPAAKMNSAIHSRMSRPAIHHQGF